MFRSTTLLSLIMLCLMTIGTSEAKAQCGCEFKYELSSSNNEITVKIRTNGDYKLSGSFLDPAEDYDLCWNQYDPIQAPFTFTGATGTGYTLTITNLDHNCSETIEYQMQNGYLYVTNGAYNCPYGCSAHACDFHIKVKTDRTEIYTYPHGGVMHQVRYRACAGGLWKNFKPSTKYHRTLKDLLPNTCYEVQVREQCSPWPNAIWTDWSDAAEWTTLP